MGHDQDAKAIAVFKQQILTERAFRMRWYFLWLWRLFLNYSVGYGYHPFRAVWIALTVCILCGFIYQRAASQGLFIPTNPSVYRDKSLIPACSTNWTSRMCPLHREKGYSIFAPWIFSLDAILPIVNLRQKDEWQPTRGRVDLPIVGKLGPDFVRGLMWFEILFGWAASLMLTAAVSGIIKRD